MNRKSKNKLLSQISTYIPRLLVKNSDIKSATIEEFLYVTVKRVITVMSFNYILQDFFGNRRARIKIRLQTDEYAKKQKIENKHHLVVSHTYAFSADRFS